MSVTAGTEPVTELLEWADAQCHAIATSTADTLATRMWRIRISLEARRRRETDPAAAQRLSERIAAIQEAEADLTSVSAILQTMGGPITWRDTAKRVGEPAF
ncbi:MAG: hypothetical protein ABSH07_11435 [Candidatus Dormibacteria bacterium]